MVATKMVSDAKKRAHDLNNQPSAEIPQPYDLILLDLDMPILNGFDACKQIREAESGISHGLYTLLRVEMNHDLNMSHYTLNLLQSHQERRGPLIIALTAFLTAETIERCRDCGFNDWIESPLTKDKIQTQIIKILEEKRMEQ